jgi:hypothetical protein
MAKQFPGFEPGHIAFIEAQHIFFTGSAAETGRVNVSPKGMDSLRILGPNRLIWRNLTGSGNETAGHLARVNRLTIMWCAFDARPLIMRAFGTATVIHKDEAGWDTLDSHFPPDIGARQVFDMDVDLVQTSCGYAVPFMEFAGDRPTLSTWAKDKGEAAMPGYWANRNSVTIDGFPTGIPGGPEA